MPTVKPVGVTEALCQVRQCLESGAVIPTPHFRDELAKEGLEVADAWHVMRKTGAIFDPPEHDIKHGEWKYKIEGYTVERIWLVIVFSFKAIGRACLITAWTVEARKD